MLSAKCKHKVGNFMNACAYWPFAVQIASKLGFNYRCGSCFVFSVNKSKHEKKREQVQSKSD